MAIDNLLEENTNKLNHANTPIKQVETKFFKEKFLATSLPVSTLGGGSGRKEEKIFVTVRVRPLNKEIALKDTVTWKCIDDHTIVSRMPCQDKSSSPVSSYTSDKVFGPSCLSDTVYGVGAKDVALSALTGISATIFAYGQPSSGKTYTMRGIFQSAVNDIYKHIHDTQERDFVIKISALEIYNEIVRDLLKPDSGPLRLLDDPKKGTIVEKLEEETVKDSQHLRHLIGICEAQRQVGETALSDTSSRSHQIIRLTVESRLREKSDCVRSYVASLNFVDLAGSDRASQAHADGIRLKEGSHINRSLLTFTTLIRKLSGGKSSGHVPYRDSKLTRVMQLSLGGNVRTAFISTMTPAFSHVEQSRNTLSFASCAKEVTNNAQVNMIVSDKQLVNNLSDEQSVKILEKRVARLEGILRTSESSWWSMCSEALLTEKSENKKHQGFEAGKGIPVRKDKFMTQRRGAPTTVHEMADSPSYLLKEAAMLEWEEAARLELEEETRVKRLKCRRYLLSNAKPKLDDLLKKHQGFDEGKGLPVQKDKFMTRRRGAPATVHEMADSPTYLLKEAARLEVEDAARLELEEEMEVKRLKCRRDGLLNAKTKLDDLLKKHQGFEAGEGIHVQKDEFMTQRRGARAIVHEMADSPTYLLKDAARLEVEDAARLELEEEMEVKRLKRQRDAKPKLDDLLKNHQGFEAGKGIPVEKDEFLILLQVKQRKLHLVNRLNFRLPASRKPWLLE